MAAVTHHVALRVADVGRAAAFYVDVFDGHFLTLPRRAEGEIAESVMAGPPGTAFDHCRIGFDDGCVELFAFVGRHQPEWASSPNVARVPHFGIRVPDMADALARVERAGGRRLWEEVERWGPASTMYASDPDGNVFELCDMDLRELVDILVEIYPESDPRTGDREPPSQEVNA